MLVSPLSKPSAKIAGPASESVLALSAASSSETPAGALMVAVLLIVAAVLLFWPNRVPGRIKGFVVMLLLGILANALVCGGISQPASRYGARVIWLLPLGATILVLFFRRARQFANGAGGQI